MLSIWCKSQYACRQYEFLYISELLSDASLQLGMQISIQVLHLQVKAPHKWDFSCAYALILSGIGPVPHGLELAKVPSLDLPNIVLAGTTLRKPTPTSLASPGLGRACPGLLHIPSLESGVRTRAENVAGVCMSVWISWSLKYKCSSL